MLGGGVGFFCVAFLVVVSFDVGALAADLGFALGPDFVLRFFGGGISSSSSSSLARFGEDVGDLGSGVMFMAEEQA